MGDVIIEMGTRLENTVVGAGTHLGPRFTVRTQGSCEVKRDGVAVGEDCSISENVVVDCGVTIGNNVRVEPVKHITRDLDDRSIVI